MNWILKLPEQGSPFQQTSPTISYINMPSETHYIAPDKMVFIKAYEGIKSS